MAINLTKGQRIEIESGLSKAGLARMVLFLLFVSCSSYQKERYISNFESFVSDVEENYADFTNEDWEEKDAEFEQYTGTGLEKHQDALTKEDKRMLGKLTARYSKVRAKAFGKQLQESLEDVHNFIDGFLEGLSDDADDNNNQ